MFEFNEIFDAELTTRVFVTLSVFCAVVMAALAFAVSGRAAAPTVARRRVGGQRSGPRPAAAQRGNL